MARLDQERQKKLEPKRIDYAKEQIQNLGLEIVYEDATTIRFKHKNTMITLYPYSGWFTGKTVKDGRGLDNLLKQLK